jgi:hypothetical protein
MRCAAFLLLLALVAGAQQLEFLNQKAAGKVARDAQGNWVFAEVSAGDVRVRKISADRTQTIYDITTGGSALEEVDALRVDDVGSAYVIGRTASKDFPVTANALPLPQSGVAGSFF